MKEFLKKESILTIPNLLSLLRIVLIPMIVYLYCVSKEYRFAVLIIIVSGITDIVDGFIARKFNMSSDVGKILDPAADKLTQLAVMICLLFKYSLMRILVAMFVIKEIVIGIIGLVMIKVKKTVSSSKWYGKVNTVLLYTVMSILFFFPGIPISVANILISVCGGFLILSFIMYARLFIGKIKEN